MCRPLLFPPLPFLFRLLLLLWRQRRERLLSSLRRIRIGQDAGVASRNPQIARYNKYNKLKSQDTDNRIESNQRKCTSRTVSYLTSPYPFIIPVLLLYVLLSLSYSPSPPGSCPFVSFDYIHAFFFSDWSQFTIIISLHFNSIVDTSHLRI